MATNWTCPHCNMRQTAIEENTHHIDNKISIGKIAEGEISITSTSVACLNPDCLKAQITIRVGTSKFDSAWNYKGLNTSETLIFSQRIIPFGTSKPQPEYIPLAIREDYREACLVKDLSPKAAATLTSRCLQGMIRDFSGISKNKLVDEIDALRKAVHDGSADRSILPETVEAIDHVRGVGNIGAHMEKDIDHIVPVDPGEAQALIDLVEMLFEEWYVAREKRKQKLAKIAGIAGEKKVLKAKPASTPSP